MKVWLVSTAGITQSGGSVSAWADQSGNSNDVIAVAGNAQPIFNSSVISGLPALIFGTGATGLNNSTYAWGADYTVIVVYQIGTGLRLIDWNFPTANRRINAGTMPAVVLDDIGVNVNSGLSIATGTTTFTCYAQDSGIASIYVNSFSSPAGSAAAVEPTATGFTVGGILGFPQGCGGPIAEVIVYDHGLTLSERTAVETYLNAKYNPGPGSYQVEVALAPGGPGAGTYGGGGTFIESITLDDKGIPTAITSGIPGRVAATGSDTPDYLASKLVSQQGTVGVSAIAGGSLVSVDIAGTPSASLVYNYNIAGFNGLAMTNVGLFAGATQSYTTGQGPLVMSTSGASSGDCEYGLNVIAKKVTIRARIVRNDLSGGTGTTAFHVTRAGGIEATLFVTEGAGAQDLVATATVTGSADSDTWGLSITNGTGATGGAFTGTITVTISNG